MADPTVSPEPIAAQTYYQQALPGTSPLGVTEPPMSKAMLQDFRVRRRMKRTRIVMNRAKNLIQFAAFILLFWGAYQAWQLLTHLPSTLTVSPTRSLDPTLVRAHARRHLAKTPVLLLNPSQVEGELLGRFPSLRDATLTRHVQLTPRPQFQLALHLQEKPLWTVLRVSKPGAVQQTQTVGFLTDDHQLLRLKDATASQRPKLQKALPTTILLTPSPSSVVQIKGLIPSLQTLYLTLKQVPNLTPTHLMYHQPSQEVVVLTKQRPHLILGRLEPELFDRLKPLPVLWANAGVLRKQFSVLNLRWDNQITGSSLDPMLFLFQQAAPIKPTPKASHGQRASNPRPAR